MTKVLKKKPLVEAILEFKWDIPVNKLQQMEGDPHYQLLLGRFSERIQSDYPFHEPLPTSQIPDRMVMQMAQHRFRTSENAWPLIQIGPGLMTVNETDKYIWDDFKSRCEIAVKNLYDAHPAQNEFSVKELTLRYIDAISVDFNKESVFKFMHDKMKTNISLPGNLFEDNNVDNNPLAFNWHTSFHHKDNGSIITLRFAKGNHKNSPALIWETLVQASKESLGNMPDGFSDWITKAHEITDDWFFKIIEGELEERFSGE